MEGIGGMEGYPYIEVTELDPSVHKYETLYDEFTETMESIGLKKVFSNIIENDANISNNDSIISISLHKDCHAISIKGRRESTIKGKVVTKPYYIFMKIYDDKGDEIRPNDTVQFSIAELKKTGLPTLTKNTYSHIIYYHYPYESISTLPGLVLKKGIVITKDKKLEIKIIRNGTILKIGKIELKLECDKWFK